jgi:hypothetical protein
MAKLTAADRRNIPKSEMGLPGKSKPGKGASSGSYPMPDRAHAINAKARAAQFASPAERSQIDAKANKVIGKTATGLKAYAAKKGL